MGTVQLDASVSILQKQPGSEKTLAAGHGTTGASTITSDPATSIVMARRPITKVGISWLNGPWRPQRFKVRASKRVSTSPVPSVASNHCCNDPLLQ